MRKRARCGMRLLSAIGVAGLAIPYAAMAGTMPKIAFLSMGFSEATVSMLHGTTNLAQRQTEPSGYLAVSADFNVDGREDEARVLVNESTGEVLVVAVIQSASKVDTYVLKTLPISSLPETGIRLAPAGTYASRCSTCSAKQIITSRPGLIIFDFSGSAELNTHPTDDTDDDFEAVPIKAFGAS